MITLPQPRARPEAPGAHWYGIAAVLIVMGPVALAWSLWTGAAAISGVNVRFSAPGSVAVRIAGPGAYSVWRDVTDEPSSMIPEDLRITIIEPMRGDEFELEPILGPTERVGSRQRFEIARATLPTPGPYEIVVEGGFDPGGFEFGPSVGPGIASGGLVTPRLANGFGAGALTLSTLLFGSLSVIGLVAGVGIIVFVWIARDRSTAGVHGQD